MNDSISELGSGQTLDVALTALTSERRRHVVRCLSESRTPTSLADLSTEIAAREFDAASGEPSPEAVKRVHLTLYHAHVPALEDANLLDYDAERESVALSKRGTRAKRLVAALEANFPDVV